jgi:c-di-GMP-related signal transduction protein
MMQCAQHRNVTEILIQYIKNLREKEYMLFLQDSATAYMQMHPWEHLYGVLCNQFAIFWEVI